MADGSFTVDLAEQLFTMWHEKTPEHFFEEEIDPPEHVYGVGEVTHIIYKSDKWEKNGNYVNYVHKFESFPALYASDGSLFPPETDAYVEVPTAKLMGVPEFKGDYGFPVLAQVLALRWFDGIKSHKIKFRSYKPVMSCSIDQRTVVIFADEMLFIHGARMSVEADGIIY